jgi:hypothetical protein
MERSDTLAMLSALPPSLQRDRHRLEEEVAWRWLVDVMGATDPRVVTWDGILGRYGR